MSNENTYWNGKGKHQVLADALHELVPLEGSVVQPHKNKALERFRKASNAYYDLYNNGLMNRAQSFAKLFGIASGRFRTVDRGFLPRMYEMAEAKMNEVVLDAAEEQGMIS